MKMEETTKAPYKAKGYKLAKGAAVELRGLEGIAINNETLKDQRIVDLILRKCPEAFGTLIVNA